MKTLMETYSQHFTYMLRLTTYDLHASNNSNNNIGVDQTLCTDAQVQVHSYISVYQNASGMKKL